MQNKFQSYFECLNTCYCIMFCRRIDHKTYFIARTECIYSVENATGKTPVGKLGNMAGPVKKAAKLITIINSYAKRVKRESSMEIIYVQKKRRR